MVGSGVPPGRVGVGAGVTGLVGVGVGATSEPGVVGVGLGVTSPGSVVSGEGAADSEGVGVGVTPGSVGSGAGVSGSDGLGVGMLNGTTRMVARGVMVGSGVGFEIFG